MSRATSIGKQFEQSTDHSPYLAQSGFSDASYKCMVKTIHDSTTITFVSQHAFKRWMKHRYGIHMFRLPDEAYIIEYGNTRILKILEKRAQQVEGSVELKLLSGPSIKREYQIMVGSQFQVEYAFCVNTFLYSKITSSQRKYRILSRILNEARIPVFHGDSPDYFEMIGHWVNPYTHDPKPPQTRLRSNKLMKIMANEYPPYVLNCMTL
jgi:hypothetical protein